MDLATLAVRITSSGAPQVSRELSGLEHQAAHTEKAVQSLAKMMNGLKTLLSVGFGIQGISSLIKMADTMTTLNGQIKLVSQSTAEYCQAKKALFDIAQRTNASLEATTTLYVRSSRALETLGISTKQTLAFTETLNQAMAVGGANAQEQASALMQLSQALGAGKLQGDEFRSISESAPIVLDVLTEYLGKSRAEVKKLASEGKITSQVLYDAISGASGKIAAQFSQLPLTFSGAMQQMQNATLQFVDELLNAKTGIMGGLAQAVSFLAQHFGALAKALLYAAGAWATYKVVSAAQNFFSVAQGVGLIAGNFTRLASAIRAATVAMATNPLGIVIAAIAGAVYVFDEFISAQHFAYSQFETTWGDVALGVWDDFSSKTCDVADTLISTWKTVRESGSEQVDGFLGTLVSLMQGYLDYVKGIVNTLIGVFVVAYQWVVTVWGNFPEAMSSFGKSAINGLIGIVEVGINKLIELIKLPLEMLNNVSASMGGGTLVDVSHWKVSFDGIKIAKTAAEKNITDTLSNTLQTAFSTDYFGNAQNAALAYFTEAGDRHFHKRKAQGESEGKGRGKIGKNFPASRDASGGSAKGRKNARHQTDRTLEKLAENQARWREYFADLQAQAKTGYEKIGLEQQKTLTEMLNRAKDAQASEQEIAQAKLLIEERYQQERRALAEKYAPKRAAERQFNDSRAEIEQLRKGGYLSQAEAQQAHQNNEWQYFMDTADKNNPINGIKQSFHEFGEDASNVMGNVGKITTDALSTMADGLTDFVLTGKADFKGFAQSIIKDITNMIIKMMIFNAIKSAASAMGGGFSNGGEVGATLNSHSTGGLVGFSQGGFTGIGGKYTPAGIVHKGEYVMTKDATRKIGTDYLDYLNYGLSGQGFSQGGKASAGVSLPPNLNGAATAKPSISVKIINNGQAVEAKVSQEQNGEETKITVELMNQMRQIAKAEAQQVITQNFARAGGAFAR